jgi:hypothetical protein
MNRTPRDIVSREKTTRYVYQPASVLPDPTPEPGYAFRWVATHILGQADPTNVSKKMREGWEPVKAADHPELQMLGNKDGNVEIGGLMLCKTSVEMVRARDAYFAEQAQAQMHSVDNNYMRDNDPRMPLFNERRTKVSFGKGN